jgi:hypothetical protein
MVSMVFGIWSRMFFSTIPIFGDVDKKADRRKIDNRLRRSSPVCLLTPNMIVQMMTINIAIWAVG